MSDPNVIKLPEESYPLEIAKPPGVDSWVILFTSPRGLADDWEYFDGNIDDAEKEAKRDRRHLNYGRNGFRIVPNICARQG